MVYRDRADDPEIARLQAVIATRRELLLERGRVRQEHDRVAQEADVAGRQLADAEDGGPLASVSAWLTGNDREREIATLREQVQAQAARLAQLVEDERVLDGKLAAIDDAEHELAQRKAARAEVLRTQGGPIAEELNALDRAIATEDAHIAVLVRALAAHQRAESLVTELVAQSNVIRSAGISGFAIEQFSFEGALKTTSVSVLRARVADLLPQVQSAIEAFLGFVGPRDDIATHMAASQLRHLARGELSEPIEDTRLAREAESAATCLERLLAKLLEIRREHEAQRAALVEQRKAIEDTSAG